MKKSGSSIFTLLLLLLFCLFLSGCSSESALDRAAALYGQGLYEEAETEFEAALLEDPDNESVHLGYAYDLAMQGRKTEALAELEPLFDEYLLSGTETETALDIGTDMLDMYLGLERYDEASQLCSRLVAIAPEEKRDYYMLQDAEIRARIYCDDPENIEDWEEALQDIISLKVYAAEEYYELFESCRSRNLRSRMMELADELIIYMNAHSAYIEDFSPLVDLLLEAADMSETVAWVNDEEYYFTAAEDFIEMAELRNMSDQDILKYKVVIAEHRGKLSLAYRLLGVYLNHYPDDSAAIKEQSYLKNRLKIDAE